MQTPDVARLELRLLRADQLLSPEAHLLTGSRLNPDVGEWLDEQWRRRPRQASRLVVRLPRTELARCSELAAEIGRYFDSKAALMDLRRRETIVRGLASARIGLVFLVVVLCGAELIDVVEGRIPEILSDGLSIFGWVALWRPTEELLYDWYPHSQDLARYRGLARLAVELLEDERSGESESPL